MTRSAPSYTEYKKFCAEKGLQPVEYDQFTFQFYLDLCKEYRIANAVQDERGVDWETVFKHEPRRCNQFVNCS